MPEYRRALLPGRGLEPRWAFARRILNPLRLPVPPSRRRRHQFGHCRPRGRLRPYSTRDLGRRALILPAPAVAAQNPIPHLHH